MGFGKKMLSTFEALIADATDGRAEAIHHLKTLVESYIYVRWIGQEDRNAKLIYAKMRNEKIKFYNENSGYLKKEDLDIWKETFADSKKGIESDWETFEKKKIPRLAKDCGLIDVYNRIEFIDFPVSQHILAI